MFLKRSFCITGLTLCTMALTTLAYADPPKRVLRLSAIEGESSFMPAGTNDWVIATVNRPLITGDSLWNDQKTQSALQMGDATICLGENSSLSILNLDDEIAQVKLSEGVLNIRIKQLTENQIYEIDTPNLAFMATQPGYYRITVNSQDNSTTVDVREGQGDVYGEENAYVMNANQAYQFTGTDLKDYEELNIAPNDQLDEWCAAYLPQTKAGASSQYVSPLVIGHEDLDRYGKWEQVEEYGYVWRPAEVEEDWAPYRVGHWVWIEPWGWNWIGEEPWGFAPYHYGRWAFIGDHWCWVPGPISVYPVYAPALVAFIGGDGFDLSVVIGADIAWFPLGPGDIYWPPFAYSKNYFSFINLSAPLITETLVVQAYQNKAFKLPYRNFKVANAITAVPKQAFVDSKQISKANVKVASDKLANAPIKQGTAAKFSKESILGTSQKAKNIPNEKVFSRRVITKSAVSDKTGKLKQETLSSKAKKPQPLSKGTEQIDKTLKRPAKEKQTPLKEIQQGKEKRLEQQQRRQLQRQELQQRRQLQRQEQQQLQDQQLKQQRQQERQELQQQRQLQRKEQQLQRQQLQQQRQQERQELQQQRQLQRQELQKQQRQLQRQENQQLQRQQLQQQRYKERQELQQQRQLQRQQLQQQHQQERHELQQQRQQYLQEQLQQRQQQLQQPEQAQQPRQQMQQQIEEEIKKRKRQGQQN